MSEISAAWVVAPGPGPIVARVVAPGGGVLAEVLGAGEMGEGVGRDGPLLVVSSAGGEGPAWMPAARAAWARRADGLEGLGRRLAVWPQAEGAVSDVPTASGLLRERGAWKLVLDPDAMLTPGMRGNLDDHMARIAAALGEHPALVGVVLPTDEAWAARFAEMAGRVEGAWVAVRRAGDEGGGGGGKLQ